ncbi:MAG: fumarylacetoacetate hydrolase family protein [Acidobacteria bacterium]|nr:fumarylacetoacetate hydrolase family protein [Acidobacteriota bacterium]
MRLVAYANAAESWMGYVDGDAVRALCERDEFYGDTARWLEHEGGEIVDPAGLVSLVGASARLFCLGLNYQSHIDEFEDAGRGRPDAPNIFGRWTSTLNVDGGSVCVPPGEDGLDWEGELAVIMGAAVHRATEEEAMSAVLGYACFNDITARKYQRRVSQFTLGKNVDGSGPLGPCIVTAAAFGDPYGKHLETRLNGAVMQSGTTDMMIFRIAETIAYISQVTKLMPGDVIATGTPDGVGWGRDPVVLMTPGDEVSVTIEGIGTLTTHIR